MVFPVVMYGCENWTIKKAEHRRIDAFELWCWRRLLRVPLTERRSNQSIIKEISPEYWDAEAESPILWPPNAKNWFTGKDPDAGKDWRWEEKGTTEDEMVGWHYWLDGHEFEQAPGVGDGQGSLVYCSPWGHKELDMTERRNWSEQVILICDQCQEPLIQVHMFHLFNKPWLGAARNQPLWVGAGVTTIHRHTVLPSWSQPSSGRFNRSAHRELKVTIITIKGINTLPWWRMKGRGDQFLIRWLAKASPGSWVLKIQSWEPSENFPRRGENTQEEMRGKEASLL